MPQGQRARRIPDAEWDQWRTELVRLYLEQCASRKEIIEFMARDHNFVITETQLKHRFEKWDVKKNISDEDMTTMLALKRKRQAIGKDIRFQYKGHIVEQERMERADKRQKRDLRSPSFIQPYIKVFDSRHQSPQDPANVFASSHNAGIDTSLVRSALTPGFGTCDRVQPVINADSVLAPGPRMESALYQGSHSADPSHIHEDVVMTEAPDILTIGSVEPDMFGDILQTPGTTDSCYAIGMADDLDSLFFQTPARTSRSDSMHLPESDSQACIDLFLSRRTPSGRTSAGALSRPSRELSHEGSHSDGSLRPGGSSSRFPSRGMMHSLGSDILDRCATPQSAKEVQGIGRVIANDIDWESISLPLLLLKSHLSAFLDGSHRGQVCNYSSSESIENMLFEMLRGKWLWAKLEDVVYWNSKATAQAIRERRDHKANEITPTSPPSTVTSQSRNSALRRREGSDTRIKTHAYIISQGLAGRLRITFGTPIGPIRDKDAANPSPELTLSYLPTASESTTGLTILFSMSPASQGSSISPYIKSFNVVPEDSEIIKAVKRNDLKAVQQLFDMNKASPLDVDPSGFSLLSYATKAKGLDVFRLLLQGGASTQNCNSGENSLDIIWATWIDFVECNVGVLSDCVEMEDDFEHCVSITDAALAYGCHIEDTTPYNLDYPNALFEICSTMPFKLLNPSCVEKVIQYLTKVGYDSEQSNETGLTPLLLAARSHYPQVIRCLRAFMKVGANLHAVDLKGRGALFQALVPPNKRNDWNGSLLPWCVGYLSSTGMSNSLLVELIETEDKLYAADYSDALEEGDVEAEFVIAEDVYGDPYLVQDPMFVLKKRTRVKLLTLLKAGCDPNTLDHAGSSPSDEAKDCGLWSEWTWALREAGYVYDVIRDCWKKA